MKEGLLIILFSISTSGLTQLTVKDDTLPKQTYTRGFFAMTLNENNLEYLVCLDSLKDERTKQTLVVNINKPVVPSKMNFGQKTDRMFMCSWPIGGELIVFIKWIEGDCHVLVQDTSLEIWYSGDIRLSAELDSLTAPREVPDLDPRVQKDLEELERMYFLEWQNTKIDSSSEIGINYSDNVSAQVDRQSPETCCDTNLQRKLLVRESYDSLFFVAGKVALDIWIRSDGGVAWTKPNRVLSEVTDERLIYLAQRAARSLVYEKNPHNRTEYVGVRFFSFYLKE